MFDSECAAASTDSNSRPCTTKYLRACCALQLVDEWQVQSRVSSKACPALH